MAALENVIPAHRMWRLLAAIGSLLMLAVPAEAQGDFEQASAAFIQQYIQEWAGPASTALAYMDQIYPDQVDFYGKTLTHEELMTLKRRFVARWPERSLSLRPDSIRVLCDRTHLCTARAVFDWHYKSQERHAAASGSASLDLVLQDGMTILSEDGIAVPATVPATADLAPRKLAPPQAAQPEAAPGVPAAQAILQRDNPRQDKPDPQSSELSRKRDEIARLRQDYDAHAADKDWMTAWLARKRDFSGQATYVGLTQDGEAPGSADALRVAGFTSAVGTIACINPDNADQLKVGQTVRVHGMITIFIEDVMYLGQCSIQPGQAG